MTRPTLILWPGAPATALPWSLWRDGICIAEGAGSEIADTLAALPAPPRVVAVVPAADAPLYRVDLPALSGAQARAAALLIAADNAAAPAADLHVGLGPRDDAGAHVAAVVSIARMHHWVARCRDAGFVPDAILPATALLPAPETGFVAATVGGEAVLRGRDCALVDEPAMRLVLGGETVERVELPPLDRAAAEAAVDLAQGPFAPRRRIAIDRRRMRRIALFALAALLLYIAAGVVELIRLRQATAALNARAVAAASAALPGTEIREPLAQLRAAALARGGGSRELMAMLGALQRGLAATPDAALAQIGWTGDGALVATVTAATPESIATVIGTLRSAGYVVPDTVAQPGVEGQRAELRISR